MEYIVHIKDEVSYPVEADNEEEAKKIALEYWDERQPDISFSEKKSNIFVFVDSSYVRDAQINIDKDENEEMWSDFFGPVLIEQFHNCSLKEAKLKMKNMYPNAGNNTFFYVPYKSE